MSNMPDAKTMAKALKSALERKKISLSHGECLDLVAAEFGFDDWNVLSAKLGEVRFDGVAPILRIFSVEKAREFYVDFLGFQVDWENRFEPDAPIYMQVSRDGCVLHLSEHYGSGTPGSSAFITTTGVDEFQRELLAKNYKYARPHAEDMPWGTREMMIADPFGNVLRFGCFRG